MKKTLLCLFLSTLLLSGNAVAQVSSENVIELLKASGLTRQIGKLPGQLKEQLASYRTEQNEQGKTFPEELLVPFNNATDAAVQPSEILLGVGVAVTKTMNEAEVAEIMEWYRSDLGTLISAEEEESNTDKAQKYVRENTQNLLNQAERADFATNIARLFNATDLAVVMQEKIGAAMMAVSIWAKDPEADVDTALLRSQMREQLDKKPARAKIQQVVVASLVHSHRNIGLRDLIKYEMYLGSDAAQKFNRLVVRSLGSGIEQAMDKWLKEVQSQLTQVEA